MRYALSEEMAQEIIDGGGSPSANVLAGTVTVDKDTWEAVYTNNLDIFQKSTLLLGRDQEQCDIAIRI